MSDNELRRDATNFADQVFKAMGSSKTLHDKVSDYKSIIQVKFNDVWSFLLENPPYKTPSEANEKTLAFMLPAFKELSVYYNTHLLTYLALARVYCEDGQSNHLFTGCGHTPDNKQCCR